MSPTPAPTEQERIEATIYEALCDDSVDEMDRSEVARFIAAAVARDRARDDGLAARVEAIHERDTDAPYHCLEDDREWPCPTVRALTAVNSAPSSPERTKR